MNLFCKDKCLICGKEMIRDSRVSYQCKNGCYVWFNTSITKGVRVFDEMITQSSYTAREWELSDEKKIEVTKRINYWKEKDRYLIKLLEGEK